MIKSTRKPCYPKCPNCGGVAVLHECTEGWVVACENWMKDDKPHVVTITHQTDSEAISAWMRLCKHEEERLAQ